MFCEVDLLPYSDEGCLLVSDQRSGSALSTRPIRAAEDEGSKLLKNNGTYLPVLTALLPKRPSTLLLL
jgi:hypothetical protein